MTRPPPPRPCSPKQQAHLRAISGNRHGRTNSPEHRARISAATRGKPQPWNHARVMTPEIRARISATLTGRPQPWHAHPLTPEHRAKLREAHVRSFEAYSAGRRGKGMAPDDRVGYGAFHTRLRKVLPRVCAHCGTTQGRLDAALLKGPWIGLRCVLGKSFHRRVYTPDMRAYARLCATCHGAYDRDQTVRFGGGVA